jgi:Zn-dependent protease with chaperone function
MESLENKPSHKLIKCPNCSSSIEVTEGYVKWCEHCLWNLKPYEETNKGNIVDRIYKNIGRRVGKELFQTMLKSSSMKPRITVAKLLALIISYAVYSISIISIVLMAYLIINFGINVVSGLLSLFLMGITIVSFPRFNKVPKGIISRSEFPALYKLLDSITKASNSKDVYGIVINDEFNASYTEIGLKRRKIVTIGLPLFYILSNEEKVALLSHEIAHGINGDIRRGLITGTALNTLIEWYEIISPDSNVDDAWGYIPVVSTITKLIMLAFSKIILLVITTLIYLVHNDSQRAEYLADYIGASISGTNEMKALLDKMHLGIYSRIALQKTVLSSGKTNFFHEILEQVNMIPKKEFERIKLVERMEESKLDVTHPPTAYRISLMEQQKSFSPKITLSESDSFQIEKEMDLAKNNIEKKLINDYKKFLYY